jgi:BirA family biotin operon repressor/biotin-[acetyl-CoA-carboxylase] ligase
MTTTDSLPGSEGGRPVLDEARLNGALGSPPGLWREVRVVEETGSTNADLLAKARSGAGEGLVLVAEAQTSGRGRNGRTTCSSMAPRSPGSWPSDGPTRS